MYWVYKQYLLLQLWWWERIRWHLTRSTGTSRDHGLQASYPNCEDVSEDTLATKLIFLEDAEVDPWSGCTDY